MKLKNKFLLLLLTFTFSILLFSNKTLATDTTDIRVYGTEDYTKANEVLQIVNKERATVGLNQFNKFKFNGSENYKRYIDLYPE